MEYIRAKIESLLLIGYPLPAYSRKQGAHKLAQLLQPGWNELKMSIRTEGNKLTWMTRSRLSDTTYWSMTGN